MDGPSCCFTLAANEAGGKGLLILRSSLEELEFAVK